jgi:hypothetical protein
MSRRTFLEDSGAIGFHKRAVAIVVLLPAVGRHVANFDLWSSLQF